MLSQRTGATYSDHLPSGVLGRIRASDLKDEAVVRQEQRKQREQLAQEQREKQRKMDADISIKST